jgi:hypothetical protein
MTREHQSAPPTESGANPRRLARWQLLLAALAASFGSNMFGQTAQPDPTTAFQPFFNPAPPPGFNAVGASDADLRTYGFPPRAPIVSTGYATWVKIVSSAKTRVANPTMWKTGIVHRPAQSPGPIPRPAGASYDYGNWSGLGVTGSSSNYFMANGSTVVGTFSVPSIVSSVENCTYAPYIASIWAGFDGYDGTSDVLQAGINAQACQSPAYYAWYEWYTPGCSGGATACDETGVNLTGRHYHCVRDLLYFESEWKRLHL